MSFASLYAHGFARVAACTALATVTCSAVLMPGTPSNWLARMDFTCTSRALPLKRQ